ncbi:MAG: D-glycerate dehydrogenase [Aestuariivita sp.]|nr:D-glycerate dehydrogenase [Aestuariivita sp.]
MKLLLSRPLPVAVEQYAKTLFNTDIRQSYAPMSLEEMCRSLVEYDIVMPTLGDFFQKNVFAEAQNRRCKLLANFGVGYNHIDVDAARNHGIEVTNTPGAVTDATADIAMTLILMTARRAGEGERLVRNEKWQGWHPTQMLGLHVTGRCVGIVGMGRIGKAIARRCHFGFQTEIRYVSRTKKELEFHATYHSNLLDLASKCDIIVISVPAAHDTYHLINSAIFEAMQSHAILINISRGDVINETELIAALQTKSLAGAGLDVYEHEPNIPKELLKMENVTLLPHLGTAALDVRTDMGMMVINNCLAFANKKALPNPV